MMSTATQASLWCTGSYPDSSKPAVYISSGEETSMQFTPDVTNEEAYYKQIQGQQQENMQKGYGFTPTTISDPLASIQGNSTAVFYTTPASQAAYSVYQWTELMRTPSYEVQIQATPVLEYGVNQNYGPLEGSQYEMYYDSLGSQNEPLQKKLVQHQPCIEALLKLEANLEMLNKETIQQRLKISRLEESCKMKDNDIAILKEQRNLQESRISTLRNNCKEKNISTEVFNSEQSWEPDSQTTETPSTNELNVAGSPSNNKLSYTSNSAEMRQELVRLRLENRDIIRLQAKVCKLEFSHDELKRMKEENLSQRHEISQLERRLQTFEEDSGQSSISRDLTYGESSSDVTTIVEMEVKALSAHTERSRKTLS